MAQKIHYAEEQLVRFSWDLPDCECHPGKHMEWCAEHGEHFSTCQCMKANNPDLIYREVGGLLYGRPHQKNSFLERVTDENKPTGT